MRELEQARSASLFATPLLAHVWADAAELNPLLRDAILGQERAGGGAALTNVGGWHSETGALEFCGEAGRRLVRHMQEMTKEATRRLFTEFGQKPQPMSWIFSAWANVNRPGDFNKMHMHPGATWSGVYYVDTGDTDAEGEGTPLHLSDPAPARTNGFFPEITASNVVIAPEPGLMLMFPSYLPHTVLPHRGAGPRISVAFNVRKEPFP